MDLPKTFKERLTPRVRNIVCYKSFENAETEQRVVVLPKDILLSILEDNKTFAFQVVKVFNLDLKQLLLDIKSEVLSFQGIKDKKTHHESTLQLMKVAEKVSREMQKIQVGSEHIILAFLRYDGKSKHILNFGQILQKYGIAYNNFFEGVISIANHVDENVKEKQEEKQKENTKSGHSKSEGFKTFEEMSKYLFDSGILKNLNDSVFKKNEKIVGRENQIKRCIGILCRKKKSNPIIIGQPGTGKTTLADGIAQAIINHEIPDKLLNAVVYEISLSNIVSGTKYRGQFEEKMVNVINFFTSEKNPEVFKIAFIDEIHHLIKAGSAEGSVDASFILKPKLADGSLRCIGTTTLEDYRKFILSDSALARRFMPVFLEEPTIEETVQILNTVKCEYEKFHGISISEQAISRCVELADIYIKDRFFPDKAFDILDESCAQTIINSIGMETLVELKNETIENVVSNMSNVPISTVCGSERERLSELQNNLMEEVVGQKQAIITVCNSIKRSRLGFKDKNKPIGSYLFVGKTGVGKTFLSKKLSEHLFGPNKLIRLDMSEYMEPHSVSKIIGSPPGYVGYESGGQLTEMVRNKPYSVILLDEIEKAHLDVINILLQVLDDGRLTDSFGRVSDFRNTIIIMTSNLSASKINKMNENSLGFNSSKKIDTNNDIEKFLKKEAEKYFSPEFINRLDEIVVFNKFEREDIYKIFEIELNESIKRLAENKYIVEVTDAMKNHVYEFGYDEKFGARPMKRAIASLVEIPLANAFFSGLIDSKGTIVIDLVDSEVVFTNK